jgi:hypothetical protein
MLLILQLLWCWSVPVEVGELHIELEEVGEFIIAGGRNKLILMDLLRPRHGRLVLHGEGSGGER